MGHDVLLSVAIARQTEPGGPVARARRAFPGGRGPAQAEDGGAPMMWWVWGRVVLGRVRCHGRP